MILLANEYDSKLLSVKKKLKYTDEFSFVPIKYNNDDLVIQTPKLYTKYGFYKSRYNNIQVYFKNIENDKILKDLLKLFNDIFIKVNKKYKGNSFIKKDDNIKYINLRVSENSIFFDERKTKINVIDANTYGNYIIYLQGLWIRYDKIFYQWNLLQAKISLPLYLSSYSFIDDNKSIDNKSKIPPPPPLPPKSKSSYKIIIPKKKNPKNKIVKNSFTPSLEEITKILSKFRKNKI